MRQLTHRLALVALFVIVAVAAGVGITVVALTNSSPTDPAQKEASMLATVSRALTGAQVAARDRRYAANRSNGKGERDDVHWIDRTDSSPLVIVAPHAVNHYRDGAPKLAERYTGAISEIVANRLGASVLTVTGSVSDWDENWDTRDDEFTRILHALPDDAIIIDLHGMADGSTPENISIGTGKKDSGPSAEIAENIAAAFGGNAEVNGTFTARSSYTVTRHMQNRGHDALQVEIAASMRDPARLNVGYTVDALTDALEQAH